MPFRGEPDDLASGRPGSRRARRRASRCGERQTWRDRAPSRPKSAGHQHQVAARRDRKELREALDEAPEGSVEHGGESIQTPGGAVAAHVPSRTTRPSRAGARATDPAGGREEQPRDPAISWTNAPALRRLELTTPSTSRAGSTTTSRTRSPTACRFRKLDRAPTTSPVGISRSRRSPLPRRVGSPASSVVCRHARRGGRTSRAARRHVAPLDVTGRDGLAAGQSAAPRTGTATRRVP